jgi:hypothetical protein
MRNIIIAGVLATGLVGCTKQGQQPNANDVVQLRQRVAQLEQQVQQISQVLEPFKAEQRMRTYRPKFERRRVQDRDKYTEEQLGEAETMYVAASAKWNSPEGAEGFEALIKRYPDVNRAGCAALDHVGNSQGEERTKYLQLCIEKYSDCFYGDGVQVGAFARFLLAEDYRHQGEEKKAAALCAEIKAKYADAIDHRGNLLLDSIKAEGQ